jgi:hypothetical protein
MKVNEITEGAWDFMMGALNPMSRKNMMGAQKGVDAAGNPIHNTAADYAASKKRPSVDDYETRYRQQYLDQATAIEKGALAPDHVSSVTRKGIDQTRREARMPPVDWAKIDADHAAKSAPPPPPGPDPTITLADGSIISSSHPSYAKTKAAMMAAGMWPPK